MQLDVPPAAYLSACIFADAGPDTTPSSAPKQLLSDVRDLIAVVQDAAREQDQCALEEENAVDCVGSFRECEGSPRFGRTGVASTADGSGGSSDVGAVGLACVKDSGSKRASVTALLLDVRKMIDSCDFDGEELRLHDNNACANDFAAATTEEPQSSSSSSSCRSDTLTPRGDGAQNQRAEELNLETSPTRFNRPSELGDVDDKVRLSTSISADGERWLRNEIADKVRPSTSRMKREHTDREKQPPARKELAIGEARQSLDTVLGGIAGPPQKQNAAQVTHEPTVQDKWAQRLDMLLKENQREIQGTQVARDRPRRQRKTVHLAGARAKPGEDWLGEMVHAKSLDGRKLLRRAG